MPRIREQAFVASGDATHHLPGVAHAPDSRPRTELRARSVIRGSAVDRDPRMAEPVERLRLPNRGHPDRLNAVDEDVAGLERLVAVAHPGAAVVEMDEVAVLAVTVRVPHRAAQSTRAA